MTNFLQLVTVNDCLPDNQIRHIFFFFLNCKVLVTLVKVLVPCVWLLPVGKWEVKPIRRSEVNIARLEWNWPESLAADLFAPS